METSVSKTDLAIGEIDLALCRSALYGALALGFRPPTEETVARLVSQEGAAALADAAAVIDANCGSALAARVLRLTEVEEVSVMTLSVPFRRLFGHTTHAAVPPYETEYGEGGLFQQPQELSDIAGFYQAFGLTLNLSEHERVDHISCECEFLFFLTLKEAYALEHNDMPMLSETRKAARLFLRDHLGRFGPAFGKRLVREDQRSFYGALGELCYRFITDECNRVGVSAGPETVDLRPATDDCIPMACGSGAECMPGTRVPEGVAFSRQQSAVSRTRKRDES